METTAKHEEAKNLRNRMAGSRTTIWVARLDFVDGTLLGWFFWETKGTQPSKGTSPKYPSPPTWNLTGGWVGAGSGRRASLKRDFVWVPCYMLVDRRVNGKTPPRLPGVVASGAAFAWQPPQSCLAVSTGTWNLHLQRPLQVWGSAKLNRDPCIIHLNIAL